MNENRAGFREVEHTADWELEVWGPDIASLLEQAARGMYMLSGARLRAGERLERELALEAADWEMLLVSFLSELLFLGEEQGIGFDRLEVEVEGTALHARLEGAPLEKVDKEIKAVTYHNLNVREVNGSLAVNIVFDV